MSKNTLILTDNGALEYKASLKRVLEAPTPDCDVCDHVNMKFEDDQFDADGKRTCKHHWYCPDCGFFQVG